MISKMINCLINQGCHLFLGPLTFNNGGGETLVGVVSWGIGCADKDYPGVLFKSMTLVSNFKTLLNLGTVTTDFCGNVTIEKKNFIDFSQFKN